MTNSIIIIHSHELNVHAEPGKEYLPRLKKWAELITQGKVSEIILTGWKATKGIDKRHCDAWREFLISQWVNPMNVHREQDMYGSVETAWEAIFARIDHWDSLINLSDEVMIISSDYHQKRIEAIHRAVFGDIVAQKMRFLWIPWFSRIQWPEATPWLESASLDTFYKTFQWVNFIKIQEVMHALWLNHWLYKKHPSNPYKLDLIK